MSKNGKLLRRFTVLAGAMAMVLVVGCSSSPKKDGGVEDAPLADENLMGDSDSGHAMGLQTVNFAFDSFKLDSRARSVLEQNAQLLKENSSVRIQIEGHCDERGGIQYNIALGENRAEATKKYLVDMGVEADRMTIISFGKEKLLDPGMTSAAHARNRRANFVVTSK